MRKKGFTISEMLIVMVIISIITAVTIPMFTVRKKMKDMELSSLNCVRKELAVNNNSAACNSAIQKAQYGKENAINTLAFLLNNGNSSAEKTAASKILKQACDNGGKKACESLVNACQKDSSLCDNTSNTYDLEYYLEKMANTNDIPKFLVYDKTKSLYDSRNTNIVNTVNNACCPTLNMACVISGCTSCPWIKHYGGAGSESGFDITASGKYIYVTGDEDSDTPGFWGDIFVMQLNADDGTVVWKKRYGGSVDESAYSLVVSGQYIYVTGTEYSDTISGAGDVLVMKLNTSDGTAVWKKHYGGAQNDAGRSLAVSGQYIYVTGLEWSDIPSGGATDIFVMKLNIADGTSVWKKHYGGSQYDNGISLAVSGNYIYVTGQESSDSVGGSEDIYVMQLNTSDGTALWKKHYGSARNESGDSIAVSSDGRHLYIGGLDESNNPGYRDFCVMMLESGDGSVAWKKRYGGAKGETRTRIVLKGNNIYLSGAEMSDPASDVFGDIFLMELDASGMPIWKKHYGNEADYEYNNSMALSPDGKNIYLSGHQSLDPNGNILIMKVNAGQTTSNMGAGWTKNGVDITEWTAVGVPIKTSTTAANSPWTAAGASTTGGTGTPMGANWTTDGVDIKSVDDTANSLWITGGAGTTGGSGTNITLWTANGIYLKKGSPGFTVGMEKTGVPIRD